MFKAFEVFGNMKRESAWVDVQNKGKRIADTVGSVNIKRKGPYDIYKPDGLIETRATVRGDHATYQTIIHQSHPRSGSITWWDCQCTWRRYVWKRSPPFKKLEGRPCSHVLALWWVASGEPVRYDDVPEHVLRAKLPELINQERLFPDDMYKIKQELDETRAGDFFEDTEAFKDLNLQELPEGLLDVERAKDNLKELEERLEELRSAGGDSFEIFELEKEIENRKRQIEQMDSVDLLNKSIQQQLRLYPPKLPLIDYIERIPQGNLLSVAELPDSIRNLTLTTPDGVKWTIGDRVIRAEDVDEEGNVRSYRVTVYNLEQAIKDAEERGSDQLSVTQRGQRRRARPLIVDLETARMILKQHKVPRNDVYIEEVDSWLEERRDNWTNAIRGLMDQLSETEDPKERKMLQEKINHFSRILYAMNGLSHLDTEETKSLKQQIAEDKAAIEQARNNAERERYERQIQRRRDLIRSLYQQRVSDPMLQYREFGNEPSIMYYDQQPNEKAQTPVIQNSLFDDERQSSLKHSFVTTIESDYSINDITLYIEEQLANGRRPKAYVRREMWGEQRGGLYPHPDAMPVSTRPDGNYVYSPNDLGYHPELMEMGHQEEERGTWGSIPVGDEVEIISVDPRDRMVLVEYNLNNEAPNHQNIPVWVPIKDVDLI